MGDGFQTSFRKSADEFPRKSSPIHLCPCFLLTICTASVIVMLGTALEKYQGFLILEAGIPNKCVH